MKILVTIPHYHDPQARGSFGSMRPDDGARAKALTAQILSLHEHFGRGQIAINPYSPPPQTVNYFNGTLQNEVKIIVVTHGEKHALRQAAHIAHLLENRPTDSARYEPPFLGIQCREVLRDIYRASPPRFDFYAFMEDDLIIHDPLFFDKLRFFSQNFGDDCLLQPNRFELESSGALEGKRPTPMGIKFYCDGGAEHLDFKPAPLMRKSDAAEILTVSVMGRPVKFRRALNPHSGCYFLNAAQMGMFGEAPYFLEKSTEFIGPLESAATLGIMKRFVVYKPHADNANFLEIQHFDPNILRGIGFGRQRP